MKHRDAIISDAPMISDFASSLASQYIAPSLEIGGLAILLESMNATATAERIASGWIHVCCMDDDQLAGIVVIRPPRHLYHLFVRSDLQRRGIGRNLFRTADDRVFKDTSTRILTVNASLNAVDAYFRLGFVPAGDVVNSNGVRFQPMVRSQDGEAG